MIKFIVILFLIFIGVSSAEVLITDADRHKITEQQNIVMGFFLADFKKAFEEATIKTHKVDNINSGNPEVTGWYTEQAKVTAKLKDCEIEFSPQFCSGALIYVLIYDVNGLKFFEALEHKFWWAYIRNKSNEHIELVIPLSLAYVEYNILERWFGRIVEMIDYIVSEAVK